MFRVLIVSVVSIDLVVHVVHRRITAKQCFSGGVRRSGRVIKVRNSDAAGELWQTGKSETTVRNDWKGSTHPRSGEIILRR